MKLFVPLRTVSTLNVREHHMARARRVKAERSVVGWSLAGHVQPSIPCVVTLTRQAPSAGLDTDNLAASLKGARDAIATWLGVDDRRDDLVAYQYAQKRGAWGVGIEIVSAEKKPVPEELHDQLPPCYVVYRHPVDFPAHFVARCWKQGAPTNEVLLGRELQDVRDLLPEGLVRVARHPSDDACIVESWW